jgi:hypothetical protein
MQPLPVFPTFWGILSDPDRDQYLRLRSLIANAESRQSAFADVIDMVRHFVVRHDGDDPKRSAACGICWIEDKIALNVRELRLLLGKCKSTVNGRLHKRGFSTIIGRAETSEIIMRAMPLLGDNQAELRRWTVRQRVGKPLFEVSLAGIARGPRSAEVDWKPDDPFDAGAQPFDPLAWVPG